MGKGKRHDLINKASAKICNLCEKNTGKKSEKDCNECPYNIILNLLKELEENP